MRRRDFLAGSTAGALGLMAVRPALSQESSNTAKQAFSFAYPLVLMDLTHRAMAAGAGPEQPAPFNQFFHFPQPAGQFTALVCPVPDALHSSAWLNVKEEPMVVSVPASGGRFYTGSFFHAWHDVIGRIGGSAGAGKGIDYLVTGPGWAGTAPKGLTQIASPTNTVWAPVWISVADEADASAAVALQSQFRVTPLRDWKGPTPSGSGPGIASVIGSFFKGLGGSKGTPQGGPPMPGPMGTGEVTIPEPGATPPAPATTPPPPPAVGETPAAAPASAGPAVSGVGRPMGAGRRQPPAAGGSDGMQAVPGAAGAQPGGESFSAEGTAAGNMPAGSSPNAQLFSMEPAAFYTRFCELMVENPPLEADAPIVAKMAKLGLTPGAKIDLMSQSRANQMALVGGVRNAGQKIFGTKGGMKAVTGNRWETAINPAGYGTNYDRRAYATLMSFGASSPEDVLCPRTSKDGAGKPLSGAGKYTLTFPLGQLPPATLWGLVAYKAPFMELTGNLANKYVINSHSPLVKNADGGVTIYLQKETPGGEKEANWLPIPDGPFELMLRLCGPKPEVAGLQWRPPAVVKV